MKRMILLILSKVLTPKQYLWIRFRLDKYLGWKGMDPKKILHYFWQNPEIFSKENCPERYLAGDRANFRSRLIVETISRYVDPKSSILEIGCNVGRNLKFLKAAGFTSLTGIEINPNAVKLLHQHHPDLARTAVIVTSSVEDFFYRNQKTNFDLIFTCEVLEHIPRESEWVFGEMAHCAGRFIITFEMEDPGINFHRIVGRDYSNIFQSYGFQRIHSETFGQNSQGHGYTLRVFEKVPLAQVR